MCNETHGAHIRGFERTTNTTRPHPTPVDCGYQAVNGPDGTLLQLSTYGSDTRQSQPKVSQTIQVDRAAAVALLAILEETFPGIRAPYDA